jgi:UDP-GlcNAc:undecaprenyl-phosphate GlcNAc-1-phosphate transferase
MLAIGHTHRQAVLIFYYWAFVLAAGAVSLVFVSWEVAIVPFAVLVAVGLGFSLWPRVRARRLTRRRSGAAPAAVP